MPALRDGTGRTIDYLRLSVTDRCNYRCVYCMPEDGVEKKAHGDILSLEELCEIAEAAVRCGVKKIRLTGGEPLLRRGIVELVCMLRHIDGLSELAMTTNGSLLPALATELKTAGLDRLNISLDTLCPERFRALTRRGELSEALAGLEAARAAGFTGTKLNAVLLGGVNDADLRPLAELTREEDLSVRFIELMPMGICADFPKERFVSAETVLAAVPELMPAGTDGVAELYRLPGAMGTVGLIRPMSRCFCASCSRLRVTADGRCKPCLHSAGEIPLRGLHGAALEDALRAAAACKPARHSLSACRASDTARCMNEIGG